eukprot:scaffold13838_cov104-Skeletonema_dohrnii-CCMP3373.AAC.1
MEVIPLDDRVRSTTVLNTATPSDFTTVYNDDNYDDAPDAFNDQLAADDLAAEAAANEGMWTRRNKLLLSLIAGSALLCAIATGSGVAAHRARVANLNSCPVGLVPVGASGPSPSGPPASAKSSKSPTAKSSKSTSGPAPTRRALTGATVPATVEEEEEVTGGAYYPEVPKTVEDKRKNRMLAEHLGQRDASSTLTWKLKNALGEIMPKLNFGSDEEKEQQRLNYERRLQATRAPTKSSKSPSAKASKSPTAKSSKSSSGLAGGIVDGLKPSDNCKCVNSGLTRSSSNGGGGGKSSKSPSAKSSKSPSTKSSKSPSTKSSKSPSTKSSKSPSTKSSKSPTAGLVGGSPLAPTTCTTPVAPLRPANPMAPGSKSSKSPTSKTGKSTRVPASTKTPLGTTPIAPVNPPGNVVKPPAPPALTKPPTASVIPPPATAETKSPTPCTVDCPGVPVVDPTPTPPTPGGGGGENPSVPKPPPSPTPGTGELTPPVPTPPTPGTPDGGPTPSNIPVTFPTRFPKLDSYGPTPETTVGVTVTVGEEDKTPPTFSPSRVGLTPDITPMPTNIPTNLGTSIGTSVGSSGGTITVSTETTGPPTLAIRDDEDEQVDDEESVSFTGGVAPSFSRDKR